MILPLIGRERGASQSPCVVSNANFYCMLTFKPAFDTEHPSHAKEAKGSAKAKGSAGIRAGFPSI